jgi:hypothetical protein
MSHLAGDYYPMYGIKNNVAKNKTPKFKMSHLFSIIAIKIVNNTNGPIVIKNAEIKAPEEIVGNFKVNITGDEPTFDIVSADVVSNIARVELSSSFPIPAAGSENNYSTLYLAVKPFDASNKDITIAINGNATKGNGVSRTIKIPANTKLEAGKITTFNVPIIELGNSPLETNLIDINGKVVHFSHVLNTYILGKYDIAGKRDTTMITFTGSTPEKISVNGKGDVDAFILEEGKVTIKGQPLDFINKVPVYFYAASLEGKKAVMRLHSMKAHITKGMDLGRFGYFGIYVPVGMAASQMTDFVQADKLKFDGLVPIDLIDKNAIILEEEPFHKQVDTTAVSNLLQNFDDVEDENKPSFKGLYDALNNPDLIKSKPNSAASITANILYTKLSPIMRQILTARGLGDIYDWLFGDATALMQFVAQDISFELH